MTSTKTVRIKGKTGDRGIVPIKSLSWMKLDRNHDHFLRAWPSLHLGQRAFTWAELPVTSELQEPLGNHMEDNVRTAWNLRALLLLRDLQRGCCSPRVWIL